MAGSRIDGAVGSVTSPASGPGGDLWIVGGRRSYRLRAGTLPIARTMSGQRWNADAPTAADVLTWMLPVSVGDDGHYTETNAHKNC
ncbi:MAG TPA: hypothetical protein VN408_26790 [Actinoplanes sp.]|nr:hypothetical protein [Actinoplanes sp.]